MSRVVILCNLATTGLLLSMALYGLLHDVGPGTRWRLLVLAVAGLGFVPSAIRCRLDLDETELIVANTFRTKRIPRRDLLECTGARSGVLIGYVDAKARSRSIASPCGMDFLGIPMPGRESRADRVARELNEALGYHEHPERYWMR